MKIDPNKVADSLSNPLRRVKAESTVPSGKVADASAAQSAARGVTPAASIQIDVAAAIASAKKADKASDVKLLEDIRAKIQSGEFEIDYDKVAESILGDAIASSMHRVR